MDKKKLGILIAGGPMASKEAPAEDSPEDMDYDSHIGQGLQDLFDSMKSGDMAGAIEAFEACVKACSMKPEPTEAPVEE